MEKVENNEKREEREEEREEESRNPNKVCSPVMYEHSHVLENMLKDNKGNKENKENKEVYKNWTPEREKLVRTWQTDIEKTSFIYNEVLMKNLWWMNFILISTLLLSVFSVMFEALSVTLGFLDMKWLGFNVVVLIFASTSAGLTGILKIFNIDGDIQILSRYVEKLNNSWFIFEIELGLPSDRRADAIDFINRADGQYLSLMQQSPSITPNDYTKANHNYQERLFENYMWSRKYKKHMKEELEEIVI